MANKFTNGIKLFDLSGLNWDVIKAALENRPYEKPYQLGISIPDGLTLPSELQPFIAKGFLEGDYYNQNRSQDTVSLYNHLFGPTTGTAGSFGVEVIVGSDGVVTDVVNKEQAIRWQWAGNRPNNSIIPTNGFVISALDKDGVRVRRQLLAHAFSIGNEVRAAALRGHLAHMGAVTTKPDYEITGNVEVMGSGTPVVKLNGQPVIVEEGGDFRGTAALNIGDNAVILTVEVDGRKTNEVTILLTRNEPQLIALELDLNGGGVLYQGHPYKSVVQSVYSDGSRSLTEGAVFHSSDLDTVKVTPDGGVLALKPGTAVITASVGEVSASQTVHVVGLKELAADESKYTIVEGNLLQLAVNAEYKDGSRMPAPTMAVFTSSHEKVATITTDGLIQALKPGMTTITVEAFGKKLSIKVKVDNKNKGNNNGVGSKSEGGNESVSESQGESESDSESGSGIGTETSGSNDELVS